MENQNKLTSEEVDELKKSLTDLGMQEGEISTLIEKAMKPKGDESSSEPTIEQKAEHSEKNETNTHENNESAAVQKEEKEDGKEKPIEKHEDEDLEKSCAALKAQKAAIEKSIDEMEIKMGKKKPEEKKEDEIGKAIENDFEKAFGERFLDIEKSLTDKLTSLVDEQNEIIKSLQAEVKKIGDTPLGTKSIITKANFFEKSINADSNDENSKSLSISRDRDTIIKGMQDMFEKETDQDRKQVLEDGISDYAVNSRPNQHGIKALALFGRQNNVTLEQ